MDVKLYFYMVFELKNIIWTKPMVLKILELNIKYVNCCEQDMV
jgi:hypothetical protein